MYITPGIFGKPTPACGKGGTNVPSDSFGTALGGLTFEGSAGFVAFGTALGRLTVGGTAIGGFVAFEVLVIVAALLRRRAEEAKKRPEVPAPGKLQPAS